MADNSWRKQIRDEHGNYVPCPDPLFAVGDAVEVRGNVIESEHIGKGHYRVRIAAAGQHLWVDQRHLVRVQNEVPAQEPERAEPNPMKRKAKPIEVETA